MRYLINGRFENGFLFSEHCDSKYLGIRIQELQDAGMEVTLVSQVEVYGQNQKTYAWNGNSYTSPKIRGE